MTACPSSEVIAQAVADPDAADPDLLAHIADCDRCRERFETSEGPTRFDLLSETTPTTPGEQPTALFLNRLKSAVRQAGTAPAWPELPDLRIEEEIARGGMGVVYRAIDLKLGRTVAVKMLPPETAPDPDALARLLREAKALAALSHPHIVSLLYAGDLSGRPYLVLEYVAGGSLRQLLRAGPWDDQDAVRLLRAVTDATAAAHALGIIHRDLKPGNILMSSVLSPSSLVEAEGSTSSGEGRRAKNRGLFPKVADFGLARFLDAIDKHTVTGVVLGTPEYMAPEQALGRSDLIGPETDVWALGGILYELLTGRPPFAAATRSAVVRQVTSTTPVSPDKYRAGLSLDLAAICMKCLEKDPKRRYRTAQALRDDLDRFLASRSVSARPRSWPGWARDRIRRHPLRSLVTGAVVMLPPGMMAGAAWAWRDAAQLRTQYENAAAELYATRMRLAAEAIADGKLAEVRDLLTMGQPLSGEPDPRGWEWAYLANRLRGPAETILHKDQAAGLHFPPPTPSPVALSPDGQRRATITATGGLEIHDATGRLLLRLPVPGGKTLTGVQFSHDGRWLAARTTDDDLVVFDGAPGGLARE